jgi:hypothetical protein
MVGFRQLSIGAMWLRVLIKGVVMAMGASLCMQC